MKILIVEDNFPPESMGGAGKVAFNTAIQLKQSGHDVLVITTARNKSDEGLVDYEGLKIFKIYANYSQRWRAYLSLYNFQTIKEVKRIIKKISPNVVYFHNIHYYFSYHCLKIAKKSGAKVFLTAHDAMLFHYAKLTEFIKKDSLFVEKIFNYKITAWQKIRKAKKRYNPFRNIIINYYLKYVDYIFAVSGELKKALNQNGIKKIVVIQNGINVDEWQFDEFLCQKFKEKFNLQNKKVVLFGGRLSGAKGGEKMVLAMRAVIEKIPESILLVLGRKDRYANYMMKLAKEKGIEQKIIFTDWISGQDLKSAYWASDLVAVPSLYLDPFPTVNLEAMACKKPVVGTCFGGTPEIVQDNITGYIVNPFDVDNFSKKIISLLKDSAKAQKMGERGYQLVKDKFSLTCQVNKILAIFNK